MGFGIRQSQHVRDDATVGKNRRRKEKERRDDVPEHECAGQVQHPAHRLPSLDRRQGKARQLHRELEILELRHVAAELHYRLRSRRAANAPSMP